MNHYLLIAQTDNQAHVENKNDIFSNPWGLSANTAT